MFSNGRCVEMSDSMDLRMIAIGKKLAPKRYGLLDFSMFSVASFVTRMQGQTFMVIGAAGELPKPPEKPIVFLEGLVLFLVQSNKQP